MILSTSSALPACATPLRQNSVRVGLYTVLVQRGARQSHANRQRNALQKTVFPARGMKRQMLSVMAWGVLLVACIVVLKKFACCGMRHAVAMPAN